MNGNGSLIGDSWTLCGRMLKHNLRSPDTIITTLVMPVMIMLAFVFVLGGAMNTGPIRYVDYVVPVVLLFAIASGVSYTAWRVNLDVTTGMYDRFRTMPIARFSMVGGQIISSVILNLASLVIIFGIALLSGYRPHPGAAGWLVVAGLLLAVLIAFAVMGVAFGMAASSNEGAGMFAYIVMALLFVSSGFAPTDTMKSGLRWFADHQPMTPIINALRSAQMGQVNGRTTLVALAWLAAMIVGFAVMATWAVRRTNRRRSS